MRMTFSDPLKIRNIKKNKNYNSVFNFPDKNNQFFKDKKNTNFIANYISTSCILLEEVF